jgi:sarcosine oxidase
MMKLAAIGWSECESATGETVRAVTGGLDIASKGDPGLDALRRTFEANGVPYETLDRDECARRFPQFRLTPSQEAVYQRDSGVLFATKAVKALWRWARQLGCETLTNERIETIGDGPGGVFVTTRSGKRYDASHAVVAPGAWLSPLCAAMGFNVPTRVSEEMVSYWEPKPGEPASRYRPR